MFSLNLYTLNLIRGVSETPSMAQISSHNIWPAFNGGGPKSLGCKLREPVGEHGPAEVLHVAGHSDHEVDHAISLHMICFYVWECFLLQKSPKIAVMCDL